MFFSSALLASLILVIAAWVINTQVLRQVRQQVQDEIANLLPVYDSVWNEHARRLETLGTAMSDSPIVKEVFGDARAFHDHATLREMISDASVEAPAPGDLVLIADGAGRVILADQQGGVAPEIGNVAPMIEVSERQRQNTGFTKVGDRLFQLVLTPVVLHSGSAEANNTMAVIGTGSEVSAAVAGEIRQRINSDVAFFVGGRLHASSFAPEDEPRAAEAVLASDLSLSDPARVVEVEIAGNLYLAFARPLADFNGVPIGQVVVLRSMARAGRLFGAITNRLILVWSLALAAALGLSFLIAGRITKPIESLTASAHELGKGNYDHPVPVDARGEIGQLAGSFDQMRASLRQSQAALLRSERLATIGQMASSIVHDLRNPLATILTAAEVMRNERIDADRRRTILENLVRASDRMDAMLSDILEFSHSSYRLQRKPHPLAEIVRDVCREMESQITHLGIRLEIQIPETIVLDVDGERFARVFENLLVNSVQAFQQNRAVAGAPPPLIEISAFGNSRCIRVEVSDNGPGTPQEIRERLFEPFISHGKRGGTGLGLAIARAIIEAHGGRIGLAEAGRRGAKFFIELPIENAQNTDRDAA
ncbi:MAG: ATP-binding protein [Blastocatellia bacterium]